MYTQAFFWMQLIAIIRVDSPKNINHIQWGKKNIWSPADFVRLPTDKEMISL